MTRLFVVVVAAGLFIGALAGLAAARRTPGAASGGDVQASGAKASPSALPLAQPDVLTALNRLVRVA